MVKEQQQQQTKSRLTSFQETFFPILTIPLSLFLFLYLGGRGQHDYKEGYMTIQVLGLVIFIVSFWEFGKLLLFKLKTSQNQKTQKNLIVDVEVLGKKRDINFDSKFVLIASLGFILFGSLMFQRQFEMNDSQYNAEGVFSGALFLTGFMLLSSVLQELRVVIAGIFIASASFFLHKAIAQKDVQFQVLSIMTISIGWLLLQNFLLDVDGKRKKSFKQLNETTNRK